MVILIGAGTVVKGLLANIPTLVETNGDNYDSRFIGSTTERYLCSLTTLKPVEFDHQLTRE